MTESSLLMVIIAIASFVALLGSIVFVVKGLLSKVEESGGTE